MTSIVVFHPNVPNIALAAEVPKLYDARWKVNLADCSEQTNVELAPQGHVYEKEKKTEREKD
jgi:hypothetical protein